MDKKCLRCQKFSYFLSNTESVIKGIPNIYCAECIMKIINNLNITKKCLFCKTEKAISEFSVGYEILNKYFGTDEFYNVRKKWICSAFCNDCYGNKAYLKAYLKIQKGEINDRN